MRSKIAMCVTALVCGLGPPVAFSQATPTVHGNIQGPYRLSIVEVCEATGANCSLSFVDAKEGDNVPQMVRDYLVKQPPSLLTRHGPPQVNVLATCAGGWLASVQAQKGSVEQGGVINGYAAVCGYVGEEGALKALMDACDSQIPGGCRQATQISVVWGKWDGVALNGRETHPGRPYQAWAYPGGMSCESSLPIVESSKCMGVAAFRLRQAGIP